MSLGTLRRPTHPASSPMTYMNAEVLLERIVYFSIEDQFLHFYQHAKLDWVIVDHIVLIRVHLFAIEAYRLGQSQEYIRSIIVIFTSRACHSY